jgi:hypothetical protein
MFDNGFATRLLGMCTLAAAASTLGCAHETAPARVHFADFAQGALKGYDGSRPLIIEFQPGETLPVNLEVDGEGFRLEPQHPPLALVATEHCFVRVGSDGFRLSHDGQHFDKPAQPGSFRVGFWSRPGQPTHLDVSVHGPRH